MEYYKDIKMKTLVDNDCLDDIICIYRVLGKFFLTTVDLATLYGISVKKIERKIKDGTLGAYKISGRYTISLLEFDKFLKSRQWENLDDYSDLKVNV